MKLEGHGLHGGEASAVELVIDPGPVRIEREGVVVPLGAFRVVSTQFSTTIGCDSFEVRTVEHLFAALAGLGIREGLRVVVTGGEVPFLDGGARAFCEALEPRRQAPGARVTRAARIDVDGSIYDFAPRDEVRVEVDVDLPACCARFAAWNGEPDTFVRDIAPARTFVLERDADELARRGLARHVDPASVLVVTDAHIAGAGEVAADEPARHKLLDLIGDAYVHGGPPRGLVRATRPGHARNHAAFARAIATGVIASSLILLSHRAARADDAARPPTLVDLTHKWPEITLEETLAHVTYNDQALQPPSYLRVVRLAYEMPLLQSPWYLGAAYDGAIGHDVSGSPRFVSGNPELWVRGVWNATYGLSFGGGFSFVVPTKSYVPADASETTNLAYAAIATRGWDRALFDPDNATLRPFLDIRLVTGPITVQYRQALEVATDFGDVAFRFAAVGTLYWGVRFSKLVTAGVSLIEYYRLEPDLADDARPYFAVGAHVTIETKWFKPSIGVMTNIGSPLNAISHIGAGFGVAPASFVGVHFSLDFPMVGVTIGRKKK